MTREEILNKIEIQEEGLDEREKSIKSSSYRWANNGVYFVLALIYVLRMIKGIEFSFDLVMIMMGQAGFMSYSLYKDGRNKKMNLGFVIFSIVLFLVATFMTMKSYEII